MRLSQTELSRLKDIAGGVNTSPLAQKKTTADLRLFGFVDVDGEVLSSTGTGRVVHHGKAFVTPAGARVLDHFSK